MKLLEHLLLIVHLLGWAALFGGLVVQAGPGPKKILPAMRDGVGTAFIAGLALVGVLEAGDEDVNHAKIGVKFTIGLVLLVLVMVNLRKERIPTGLWAGLLALTVTNVAVAVLW